MNDNARPAGPTQLLMLALDQWRDSCPGAGWEHHGRKAYDSLIQTPSMQELIDLAREGANARNQRALEAVRREG